MLVQFSAVHIFRCCFLGPCRLRLRFLVVGAAAAGVVVSFSSSATWASTSRTARFSSSSSSSGCFLGGGRSAVRGLKFLVGMMMVLLFYDSMIWQSWILTMRFALDFSSLA